MKAALLLAISALVAPSAHAKTHRKSVEHRRGELICELGGGCWYGGIYPSEKELERQEHQECELNSFGVRCWRKR